MKKRMDYYKFTHYFLPHTLFNFSEVAIGQILKDKEKFAQKLKLTWRSIKLEGNEQRSQAPSFSFEIKKINDNYTLIVLKIPEAKDALEAPFIGIVFNKKYKVRYFTYEIAESLGDKCYLLCEWDQSWNHKNYMSSLECDINKFVEEIKNIISMK